MNGGQAIAVGSREYVDEVKTELGNRAAHRQVADVDASHTRRQRSITYTHDFEGENELLRPNNTRPWNENVEATEA